MKPLLFSLFIILLFALIVHSAHIEYSTFDGEEHDHYIGRGDHDFVDHNSNSNNKFNERAEYELIGGGNHDTNEYTNNNNRIGGDDHDKNSHTNIDNKDHTIGGNDHDYNDFTNENSDAYDDNNNSKHPCKHDKYNNEENLFRKHWKKLRRNNNNHDEQFSWKSSLENSRFNYKDIKNEEYNREDFLNEEEINKNNNKNKHSNLDNKFNSISHLFSDVGDKIKSIFKHKNNNNKNNIGYTDENPIKSSPWFCHDKDCPPYKNRNDSTQYETRIYDNNLTFLLTKTMGHHFEYAAKVVTDRIYDYIGGNNDKNMKLPMTTPVTFFVTPGLAYTNFTGAYFLPYRNQQHYPNPNSDKVCISTFHNDKKPIILAVRSFGGFPNSYRITGHLQTLINILKENNIKFNPHHYLAAIYDKPTRLKGRHNEVALMLEE